MFCTVLELVAVYYLYYCALTWILELMFVSANERILFNFLVRTRKYYL